MKSPIISEIGARVAKRLGDDRRKQFEGKTVLITGANGFLGQYFLEAFVYLNKSVLKTPCEIVAADSHITNTTTNDSLGVLPYRFLLQDVSKPFPVEEKPDYILHAAGIASPMYYRRFPLETIDVATLGTRSMLDLARKVQIAGPGLLQLVGNLRRSRSRARADGGDVQRQRLVDRAARLLRRIEAAGRNALLDLSPAVQARA